MFGLSIIRKAELNRLRELDKVFREKMSEKNGIIKTLEEQVKSLTQKRNEKGQFVKA